MRTVVWLSLIVLMSAPALAGKVVVVPASFEIEGARGEFADQSQQIETRVVLGIEDTEHEALLRANETVIDGGPCRDQACLEALASSLDADLAIYVGVTKKDDVSYQITLVPSRGETVDEVREDGFFVILGEVRRLVALAVQSAFETGAERTQPLVEGPAPPTPAESFSPPGLGDDHGVEQLGPTGFYVSVALTSALAIGWIVTESVGYAQMTDLEERERDDAWDRDHEALNRLQIADYVLIGLTAASAATTTVLFFLTDFDKRDQGAVEISTQHPRLVPAVSQGGAMMVLQGSF